MQKILFPGSFDPFTKAHQEILERLLKIGYQVEIGILNNNNKKSYFTSDERKTIIANIINKYNLNNANVFIADGLLVNICKEKNINIVARGIRSVKDYEYEKEMEHNNKQLNPNLEYIYLNSSTDNNYVSSSIIRELINYNESFAHLVDDEVLKVFNKVKENNA